MSNVSDTELDAFDNRCSARTRRGQPCKNPVFFGQWYRWDVVVDKELPDGRRIVRDVAVMSERDHARMLAHVCGVHEETHARTRRDTNE